MGQLKLTKLVEPLSGKSRPDEDFAKCDAYDRLRDGIEQYVMQRINGRSFLVAGHRGSGKTFLVYKAIEALIWKRDKEDRPYHKVLPRPLIVRVHGPDLLKTSQDLSSPEPNVGAGNALRLLTTALHRSVCDEFADCYRDRSSKDDGEIAAQFRLELDRTPPSERLKMFWQRAGALGSGILASPADSQQLKSPAEPTTVRMTGAQAPDVQGQGYRELTALATLIHAADQLGEYRRMDDRRRHSSGEQQGNDYFVFFERLFTKSRPFIGPLSSTIFGITVAAILIKEDVPAVASLAAGLLTTLVLLFLFNLSRDRSENSSLVHDDSPSTMTRAFPILIERVRDAGLAPIFVVDELDKVDNLYDTLGSLMNGLKGLVSDQAMFCFVSDRSYFDRISALRRRESYPVASTYFNDIFYTTYSPDQIDELLTKLITPAAAGGNEEMDVLRSWLKFRSRMHLGDLIRLANSRAGADRTIEIEPNLKTVKGYRYAMDLQEEVEKRLKEGDLKDRIRQDPYFLQSAYDALYYVPREWEKRSRRLDTSKPAFARYMADRAGAGAVSGSGEAGHGQGGVQRTKRPRDERELDVDFLHLEMLSIVRRLKEMNALKELVAEVEFEWKHDEYGRELHGKPMLEEAILLADLGHLLGSLAFPSDSDEPLAVLGQWLGVHWNQVDVAVRTLLRGPAPEASFNTTVQDCIEDLRQYGDLIRKLIAVAAMKRKAGTPDPVRALVATLIAKGPADQRRFIDDLLGSAFDGLGDEFEEMYGHALFAHDGSAPAWWLRPLSVYCRTITATVGRS